MFVDEMFIESSRGVHLTMNLPYQMPEPVIVADQPWEESIHVYSSVIKEGRRIRTWYTVSPKPPAELCVAYAESTDGIYFTKPKLNLVKINGSRANNVVLPGRIGGCAVWIDGKAPPEQRYKTQAKVYPSGQFHMHTSPDGYRWTLLAKPEIGHKDTQSIIFWDDAIHRYVLYTRFWMNNQDRASRYRLVRRLESDDFVRWDNEIQVMKADKVDLAGYEVPTWTRRPPVDYYGAAVFKYPEGDGVYIMLAQAFWPWYDRSPPDKPAPDIIDKKGFLRSLGPNSMDVRLAVSRDGRTFERAGDRRPFLRLGPAGRFDSRIVWALPNPIRMGNELWIYYAGSHVDHAGQRDPTSAKRLSGIARAVMRVDGFVSADADYAGGEIVTPLITFEGSTLELNLDTSGGGSVRVELLDEKSRPMQGYTKSEATPLCGNSIRMPASWGKTRDVSKLAGKPIKIRVVMRDCKLYAFQFKK